MCISTPYYLYKLTNSINGKLYIGVTKDLDRRWVLHCSKHSQCKKLKAAISKYGKDNFTKEIICIGSKSYILDLEEKMIAAYDSTVCGYNISKGGQDYPTGPKLEISKADQPVNVSGFWFPDRLTALNMLEIRLNTFYKWKRESSLDSEEKPFKFKGKSSGPCFLKGFWFPSIPVAMQSLSLPYSTVYRQSKENPYGLYFKEGSQKGFKSKTAKAVVIENITYGSIKEAARELGIMPETIRRRIKNKQKDYAYATSD